MKSYAIILVVYLVVFKPASTGQSGDGKGNGQGKDGRRVNIKTKEDCDAFNGTCNKPTDCNLTKNVHIEPASGGTCSGDVHDFCCIHKAFMCAVHANGTFISDAACHAKPGFTVTGLNLDGLNCCKPRGAEDGDDDHNGGSAAARLSSGMIMLMIAVCANRMF